VLNNTLFPPSPLCCFFLPCFRPTVREQEIFAKGESRKAATLAALPGKEDIEFKRSAAGKYTVTDPQGFSANVGKPIHPDDNKTILPIDRVLLGSESACTGAVFCGAGRLLGYKLKRAAAMAGGVLNLVTVLRQLSSMVPGSCLALKI